MSYFLTGGGVAASQQFAANQTDVFSVDQNGQLTVSWVDNAGEWQGPITISPAGRGRPGLFCRSQPAVWSKSNRCIPD